MAIDTINPEINFALWLFENHWALRNVELNPKRYEFMRISYNLFTDLDCEHPKSEYKYIEELYDDYIKERNG